MIFNLKYSEAIQGLFQPTALNLMMVFQVNCPGCFLNGFPQMRSLHTKYLGRLSCFALSTAFEDFELNTIENTRLLLEKGKLVGETKKTFDANNLVWETPIPFTVLADVMVDKEEILQPQFMDSIISNHSQFNGASPQELEEIKISLRQYFNHYPKCGFTFASNLFQGTPTFVLFNANMDILLQWFGYVDIQAIEKELIKYIP